MKNMHFLFVILYILCFSATALSAAESVQAKVCKSRRAAIIVGPSDVKGYIYCISSNLSELEGDVIRPDTRTGVNAGVEDSVLSSEYIDTIINLVEEVESKITIKKVVNIDIIVSSSGNNIINFDRLIEKIKNKLTNNKASESKLKINFHSTAKEAETAYGFLDALNLLLPDCKRPDELNNSIYINISSSDVNLLYYTPSGIQFRYLQIPIAGAQLAELLRLKDPNAKSVVIEKFLGKDFEKIKLLRRHPDLFNKEWRPNIYITGGTVWAMSGLIASINSDILKLLYATDKQENKCYIENKEKNISLLAGDFEKAFNLLQPSQSINNPVERFSIFAKQLEKQLLNRDTKEISKLLGVANEAGTSEVTKSVAAAPASKVKKVVKTTKTQVKAAKAKVKAEAEALAVAKTEIEGKEQLSLGDMYFNGRGVEKNEVMAVKWYQKAAELGNSDAKYKLGRAYETGIGGLTKNDKEAAVWYLEAAKLNHSQAQLSISDMYSNGGGGFEKNKVEADKWYKKSVAQKNLEDVFNARKTDVSNQLNIYGYSQDDLLAQLTLADWVLDFLDRKKCENGINNECSLTYINRQDNWARIFEYGLAVADDPSLSVAEDLIPVKNKESITLSSILKNIKFIPTVSFRSRDMLRK